jgi:hypothetical protein
LVTTKEGIPGVFFIHADHSMFVSLPAVLWIQAARQPSGLHGNIIFQRCYPGEHSADAGRVVSQHYTVSELHADSDSSSALPLSWHNWGLTLSVPAVDTFL